MQVSTEETQFRRLFTDHYAPVLRYFVRRIGHADAPDAADEVFLVAWRRLDSVPPEPEALPWLYGVARKVLANHQRSARRRGRLRAKLLTQPRRNPSGLEAAIESAIGVDQVRAALACLAPRDQEILTLSAWDGLSHAAIGKVLGCSENAVAVRIHRARKHLEKALERAGHRGRNRAAHAAEGDEPW